MNDCSELLNNLADKCHKAIDRMRRSSRAHKMLMAAEKALTLIASYKANRKGIRSNTKSKSES